MRYQWSEIKTIEELKTNKFSIVKEQILSDLGLKGIISIKSYDSLLKFIIFITKYCEYSQLETKEEDKYFKSTLHKLAFMLENYNPVFDEFLGIKDIHYVDDIKAKEWRNEFQKIFHPDTVLCEFNTTNISNTINSIYNRMVGRI